jgi:NAD(P)-dependent dehydrogenase (short-subunit alcohol dehydrogenase family)
VGSRSVISGGAGIGQAISRKLGRASAKVRVANLNTTDAERVASEICGVT